MKDWLHPYVGSKIHIQKTIDGIESKYLIGILKYDPHYQDYYLHLEKAHYQAHDCDGHTPYGHGWWVGDQLHGVYEFTTLEFGIKTDQSQLVLNKIKYLNNRYNKRQKEKGNTYVLT